MPPTTAATPTDPQLLAELGRRLARHRLERNLTQAHLAREAGLSTRTLIRIEQGHSTSTTNLVRLLRALDLLENLDQLVPEPLPSPLQQLERQGRRRQRASSAADEADEAPAEPWSWEDDT